MFEKLDHLLFLKIELGHIPLFNFSWVRRLFSLSCYGAITTACPFNFA
jgi:hypothetical protein